MENVTHEQLAAALLCARKKRRDIFDFLTELHAERLACENYDDEEMRAWESQDQPQQGRSSACASPTSESATGHAVVGVARIQGVSEPSSIAARTTSARDAQQAPSCRTPLEDAVSHVEKPPSLGVTLTHEKFAATAGDSPSTRRSQQMNPASCWASASSPKETMRRSEGVSRVSVGSSLEKYRPFPPRENSVFALTSIQDSSVSLAKDEAGDSSHHPSDVAMVPVSVGGEVIQAPAFLLKYFGKDPSGKPFTPEYQKDTEVGDQEGPTWLEQSPIAQLHWTPDEGCPPGFGCVTETQIEESRKSLQYGCSPFDLQLADEGHQEYTTRQLLMAEREEILHMKDLIPDEQFVAKLKLADKLVEGWNVVERLDVVIEQRETELRTIQENGRTARQRMKRDFYKAMSQREDSEGGSLLSAGSTASASSLSSTQTQQLLANLSPTQEAVVLRHATALDLMLQEKAVHHRKEYPLCDSAEHPNSGSRPSGLRGALRKPILEIMRRKKGQDQARHALFLPRNLRMRRAERSLEGWSRKLADEAGDRLCLPSMVTKRDSSQFNAISCPLPTQLERCVSSTSLDMNGMEDTQRAACGATILATQKVDFAKDADKHSVTNSGSYCETTRKKEELRRSDRPSTMEIEPRLSLSTTGKKSHTDSRLSLVRTGNYWAFHPQNLYILQRSSVKARKQSGRTRILHPPREGLIQRRVETDVQNAEAVLALRDEDDSGLKTSGEDDDTGCSFDRPAALRMKVEASGNLQDQSVTEGGKAVNSVRRNDSSAATPGSDNAGNSGCEVIKEHEVRSLERTPAGSRLMPANDAAGTTDCLGCRRLSGESSPENSSPLAQHYEAKAFEAVDVPTWPEQRAGAQNTFITAEHDTDIAEPPTYVGGESGRQKVEEDESPPSSAEEEEDSESPTNVWTDHGAVHAYRPSLTQQERLRQISESLLELGCTIEPSGTKHERTLGEQARSSRASVAEMGSSRANGEEPALGQADDPSGSLSRAASHSPRLSALSHAGDDGGTFSSPVARSSTSHTRVDGSPIVRELSTHPVSPFRRKKCGRQEGGDQDMTSFDEGVLKASPQTNQAIREGSLVDRIFSGFLHYHEPPFFSLGSYVQEGCLGGTAGHEFVLSPYKVAAFPAHLVAELICNRMPVPLVRRCEHDMRQAVAALKHIERKLSDFRLLQTGNRRITSVAIGELVADAIREAQKQSLDPAAQSLSCTEESGIATRVCRRRSYYCERGEGKPQHSRRSTMCGSALVRSRSEGRRRESELQCRRSSSVEEESRKHESTSVAEESKDCCEDGNISEAPGFSASISEGGYKKPLEARSQRIANNEKPSLMHAQAEVERGDRSASSERLDDDNEEKSASAVSSRKSGCSTRKGTHTASNVSTLLFWHTENKGLMRKAQKLLENLKDQQAEAEDLLRNAEESFCLVGGVSNEFELSSDQKEQQQEKQVHHASMTVPAPDSSETGDGGICRRKGSVPFSADAAAGHVRKKSIKSLVCCRPVCDSSSASGSRCFMPCALSGQATSAGRIHPQRNGNRIVKTSVAENASPYSVASRRVTYDLGYVKNHHSAGPASHEYCAGNGGFTQKSDTCDLRRLTSSIGQQLSNGKVDTRNEEALRYKVKQENALREQQRKRAVGREKPPEQEEEGDEGECDEDVLPLLSKIDDLQNKRDADDAAGDYAY